MESNGLSREAAEAVSGLILPARVGKAIGYSADGRVIGEGTWKREGARLEVGLSFPCEATQLSAIRVLAVERSLRYRLIEGAGPNHPVGMGDYVNLSMEEPIIVGGLDGTELLIKVQI